MDTPATFQTGNRIAVSFRGYNVTNAGRTKELLSHPLLADRLRDRLDQASRLCHDVLGIQVDLHRDVASGRPSTLETYSPDLAMIVAVELAHWDALQETLGKEGSSKIRLLTGYSLGEVTAVIVAGLMSFEAAMAPILELSVDAAALAPAVSMGIVFSRGPTLDVEIIRERCIELTARGHGVIAISTYLSPNTVLLMGEGDTVDDFKAEMAEFLPKSVHLRKNLHHWPPLHTPIVLKKHLRDRAAVMLQTAQCRPILPELPILSCVEGDIAYNGRNTRHLMTDWVDHPQRLWDCVHAMLRMGIDQVIHLGPEPNILPATLTRLADNVQNQLDKPSWYSYGLRTFSRWTADRQWLANLISRDAVLLRAPFVKQVNYEDWLVEAASTATEQSVEQQAEPSVDSPTTEVEAAEQS